MVQPWYRTYDNKLDWNKRFIEEQTSFGRNTSPKVKRSRGSCKPTEAIQKLPSFFFFLFFLVGLGGLPALTSILGNKPKMDKPKMNTFFKIVVECRFVVVLYQTERKNIRLYTLYSLKHYNEVEFKKAEARQKLMQWSVLMAFVQMKFVYYA